MEHLAASRILTFTFNPHDNLNDHIDIMVGTVGSALSPNHLSEPPDERELQRRYGPVLHLPLRFPRDDFIGFLDELEADIPAFLAPRTQNAADVDQRSHETNELTPIKNLSPKTLSDEIVKLADLGTLPKFQDAKSLLGNEGQKFPNPDPNRKTRIRDTVSKRFLFRDTYFKGHVPLGSQ